MYDIELLKKDINQFRTDYKFLKPTKISLSIADFAKNCGLSYTNVYEIIAHDKQPSSKTIDKLCIVLCKNAKEYTL